MSHIYNLTSALNTRKRRVIKPKVRRKKIKKIRDEITEMENRKTKEEISKTKSWSFEKIYKIEKLLSKLIR